MADHQRFTIDEIAEDGKSLAPKDNANLFVSQCGVIVRDNIPITTREWNKPKVDDGSVSYVDQRSKDALWDTLLSHFNLPPECDGEEGLSRRMKVKEWALKKMATQFQSFKKRLYNEYIKKNKTPEFTGPLEKQKHHWAGFVAYKASPVALQRSEKNKKNAAKKKYHHVMGTGGYKSAVPKWEQSEAAMIAKGITLGTAG